MTSDRFFGILGIAYFQNQLVAVLLRENITDDKTASALKSQADYARESIRTVIVA